MQINKAKILGILNTININSKKFEKIRKTIII